MSALLPFDLTEVVHQELEKERRENDYLAHASSHIAGSLRHAQLDVAGAPKIQGELLQEITLKTGTFWHEWMHGTLRRLGVPYMAEVNMTPWLPSGWAGTLDALFWNPELKGFVLTDFKTQKGEGIKWLRRDGAKEEHRLQTSAYWHAAKKMGIPLAKAVAVYYLPKNDTRSKDDIVEPLLLDFAPIGARTLHANMKKRWGRISEYRESLPSSTAGAVWVPESKDWITDALEPVQAREQRLYLDKDTGTYDVKLVPHWSAPYCPFPVELCDCSTQGTTKIGYYDLDGEYYPRKGYEEIEPTVSPS